MEREASRHKLRIDYQTIRAIEAGERRSPKVWHIHALAVLLGQDEEELAARFAAEARKTAALPNIVTLAAAVGDSVVPMGAPVRTSRRRGPKSARRPDTSYEAESPEISEQELSVRSVLGQLSDETLAHVVDIIAGVLHRRGGPPTD
jgi:hypothetical protein